MANIPSQPKRAILVSGSNWSGSTLAGTVLGASPDGPLRHFHVGEIHAFNSHHKVGTTYGDPRGARKLTDFWNDVSPLPDHADLIADICQRSQCESIIDSSKVPGWFAATLPYYDACGIRPIVVITIRPFAAVMASGLKRQGQPIRISRTLGRYLQMLKFMKDHDIRASAVVDTAAFAANPAQMTKALCEATGVPYFEGKHEYWRFPSAHLYGSKTQRQHLMHPKKAGYHPRPPVEPADLEPDAQEVLQSKELIDLEHQLRSGGFGPLIG